MKIYKCQNCGALNDEPIFYGEKQKYYICEKCHTATDVLETKKINEICKAYREFLKITQHELAEKVGVRIATISDFETGKKGINSRTLEKIFDILKINLK